MDGGDVSCLWTDEGFYTSEGKIRRGYYGPLHYSERGEDCPPRLDANLIEYVGDGEEYAYLYTLKGEWVCYELHETPKIVEIPSAPLHV